MNKQEGYLEIDDDYNQDDYTNYYVSFNVELRNDSDVDIEDIIERAFSKANAYLGYIEVVPQEH